MPTVSADDIVGFAPGTRGRTISPDDIVGLGEIPTYAPQTVTDDDIVPTPQELSTLEAPEGSPQREDINKGVAGNLFAPPGVFARDPTLAELIDASMPRGVKEAMRDERRIPLAPPLPEQGQFEQGGLLPYVAGLAQTVDSSIPRTWEQAREMIKPPMGGVDIEKENELGAAWRGERGPVEQAAAISGTALQALPLLHLPFAESPLRPTKTDSALVQKLMEARNRELTPPPIPPEYAERRFSTPQATGAWEIGSDGRPVPAVPRTPEPPPDIAPSVPIEQTLPRTAPPIVSPETGFGHYPTEAPATESRPVRTEFALAPGAEAALRNRLAQLEASIAPSRAIGQRVSPKIEAELARIRQHLGIEEPPVVDTPQEAPVNAQEVPGTVRLYHGGAGEGAGTDFTPFRDYAQGYADKTPGGKVWYVDVPKGEFLTHDEYGVPITGVKLPPEWMAKAKPLEAPGGVPVAEPAAPLALEIPESDRVYAGEQQPSGAGQPQAVPQKPSKIGQSIEAKAVEAKLTQGFAETAGYDPITIKDQAARATSVIQDSVPNARAIVRGEAPLPDGLRGTSLITAMEEHLLRNPDSQLAYELANSPLTSATSAAAQEMRLMAERVPDGIAAKFTEIKRAREAGARQRGETPEKVKAEINGEVVKAASKRPTWEQFVREIVC